MAVLRETARTSSSTSSSTSATATPTARRPASRRCSGIGMEVTVAEYRNGNEKENSVTQDHRPEQGDRRHAEARRDRLAQPLQLARRDPQRRPERAAHRHDPAAERGPHARSCRPGSCCARGSSSTSAARSTPRAPTWRWRSWRSPTSGWRWSERALAALARRLPGHPLRGAAPAPPATTLPRMDIAVFVGFAARGAARTCRSRSRASPPSRGLRRRCGAGAWQPATGEARPAALAPAVRAFFSNGGTRCWGGSGRAHPRRWRRAGAGSRKAP